MDKEIKYWAENVLNRNTKLFLSEIDNLIDKQGVGRLLAEYKKREEKKKEQKAAEQKAEKRKKIPGRTQFKTLMDAARKASCIEELLLFLAYQKSKKQGWDTNCEDGEDIAKKLIDSFMKVQDGVYACIEQENGANEISGDDERLLRLMIAEKYLGYLYWKASVAGGFREES